MNTFNLALRNLLRNRRRSLTTLLAIIIGCNAMLLFEGFSRDIKYTLQTSFVQRTGHMQIQHKDYFLYGTGNPGAYGIADYNRVIEVVKTDPVLAPMLQVVTPTLQFGGIGGNFDAGVSRTVFGTGMVVDDQNLMRQWNDYQLPWKLGQIGLTGSSEESAMVGLGVARVLQLCGALKVANCPSAVSAPTAKPAAPAASVPADIARLSELTKTSAASGATSPRIELLASNPYGAPNVTAVNVVEASSQGVKELDDVYIGVHLAQAQRLVYGREKPMVTAIVLQLQHTAQLPAAKARLDELLATTLKDMPLEINDFTTLHPQYGQTIGMFGAIFGFVAILISAIVLFMVGNTMSTAVIERTVEIGTLRAIGIQRTSIRRTFLAEGALLGLIGATLGAVIAVGISLAVNASGLTWVPPGQVNAIPLSIRVWGETRLIFVCSIGVLLVSVLSALWPARRAARMNIVDALRHV
jgi:putative ABC transport system permease protein